MTSNGFLTGSSGHPRYRIIRCVGEGAGGVVFEAEDLEKNEIVALKTLRRHNSQALFSLKREFRSLADSHHPHLATLYDLFVEVDEPFFTMEFVDGVDVREYCAAKPSNDPVDTTAETITTENLELACDLDRLRRILPQLAEGIRALHQRGLLHRDIKPSNLKVNRDGQVKILDFGLAVGVQTIQDESQFGHTVGTDAPRYRRGPYGAAGG